MSNSAIQSMLSKYDCQTHRDYLNALKEVFQEIALLGLWRAKFFEHAAFYGGTALRILYGLDRFSEDMDFSLLKPQNGFDLDKYNRAIVAELQSFGFEVTVTQKTKRAKSTIESAFIKANTVEQFIQIDVPAHMVRQMHKHTKFKIKMDVDTQPPGQFTTEAKALLMPIPFSVLSFVKEDLFAGKAHAMLCRSWKTRVKGRDWYDFYWYVSRDIPVNLTHLDARLKQTGHLGADDTLTEQMLKTRLIDKIDSIDFEMAKANVIDFIRDPDAITLWSKSFFHNLAGQMKTVSKNECT